LIPLYEQFVVYWEKKMNKVSLVQFCIVAARQFPDPKLAISFLNDIALKMESSDKDALVLATMEAAHFKLVLNDLAGARKAVDDCQKWLDTLNSVEPLVHGSFYRVSADYYKAKMDYAQYYKNALLYLACIQLEELSVAERVERAHDLVLCALLGETIYNFGELLMHPVLDSLKATPHEWLAQLLFAFNAGDIGRFDSLSSNFTKQPLLSQNMPFLRQKLCLMALIELVFRRPGDARHLPFSLIASETRLPHDEVEHLLMKALSLNLIRGRIDQVEQVIDIEWVQPRVLDKKQIANLRVQIQKWQSRVAAVSEQVEKDAVGA